MTSSRAVLLVTLAVGTLILAVPRLEHPVRAGSASSDAPYVTRVFYLQGMELSEAITLLRSRVHVRQMVEIPTRNAIVVCEVADRVDRSESLLRENDALVRATDPHVPVSFERAKDSPLETRVFPVESDDTRQVVTILRGHLSDAGHDGARGRERRVGSRRVAPAGRERSALTRARLARRMNEASRDSAVVRPRPPHPVSRRRGLADLEALRLLRAQPDPRGCR